MICRDFQKRMNWSLVKEGINEVNDTREISYANLDRRDIEPQTFHSKVEIVDLDDNV